MGGPNSPRADCTLARATLTHTQLDDGRPKRVRIILERSRFERGAHAERGGASGVDAMRLVVYVADLHDAQSHTQARARARPRHAPRRTSAPRARSQLTLLRRPVARVRRR